MKLIPLLFLSFLLIPISSFADECDPQLTPPPPMQPMNVPALTTIAHVEVARASLNQQLQTIREKLGARLSEVSTRPDKSLAVKENGPLSPEVGDEVIRIFGEFNAIAAQVTPPTAFGAVTKSAQDSVRGLARLIAKRVATVSPTAQQYLETVNAKFPELERTAASLRAAIADVKLRKAAAETEIQSIRDFIADIQNGRERLMEVRKRIEDQMLDTDNEEVRLSIQNRLLVPLDAQILSCDELVTSHQAVLAQKIIFRDKVDEGVSEIERSVLIAIPTLRHTAVTIGDASRLLQGLKASNTLRDLSGRAITAAAQAIDQVYRETDDSRSRLVVSATAIGGNFTLLNKTLADSRQKTDGLAARLQENFATIRAEQDKLSRMLADTDGTFKLGPQIIYMNKPSEK